VDPIRELIDRIEQRAVGLSIQDGRLKLKGEASAVHEFLPELKANKHAVLAFLGERESQGALSVGQLGLLSIQERHLQSTAYNVALAFECGPTLDRERLERALRAVLARHSLLDSRVEMSDGNARWRGIDGIEPGLQISTANGADVEGAMRALANRPFDLASERAIRVHLLEQGDTRSGHVLLVFHHIAVDFSSVNLVCDEIAAAYAGGVLPDLPPFSAFVSLEQKLLSGMAEAEAYWAQELRQPRPALALPFDGQTKTPSLCGEVLSSFIDTGTWGAVKAAASSCNVTPFCWVLSAYFVVLGKYSREADLTVGVASVNRPAGFEGTIGSFANMLPIRALLGMADGFETFVRAVSEKVARASDFDALPFPVLVQRLAEAQTGRTPVFQTLLSWHAAPATAQSEHGPWLSPAINLGQQQAPFELMLSCNDSGDRLHLHWNVDTGLFSTSTASTWMQALAEVLQRSATHPGSSLAELTRPTAMELRAQLLDWNDGSPIQDEETLDGMLEMAARRWEGEPAVSMHGVALSYGELRRRSQLLAWHLQQLGVQPSSRVGVSLGRDEHLVPALWAVLRCGAAYVPLDPSYPAQRLEFIRADAGVEVVLCPQARRGEFEAGGARCVAVDALDWTERREARTVAHRPQDLAYVLYTSGSTGQPKGVMLEHRNAVNLVKWAWSAFSRDELALTLASTSINFDLSVFEIFAPLTAGHAIWLVDNALATADYPEQGLTLINTVPSLAQALVRSGSIPSSVRVFTLCGEPLTRELADALYARGHIEKVYNLYGPTETTTYSTVSLVPRSEDAPVRIGKPLRGTQLYVLDEQGEPAPLGVAGELFIGGAGVARGYHRRDELTAERFVWRELPLVGRQRVYRTGDRVRWLANGELDFLGRIDQQIKLRGYRIELEEIEHHLRAQKGIASAVVGTETGDHGPMLVAYLVLNDAATGPDVADAARTALSRVLPDYMVPGAYRILDAMPLTPNGKLDRQALGAAAWKAVASTPGVQVPAGNSAEQTLLEMWNQTLGSTRQIGVTSSFFSVGGDSLLAMQLLFKMRRAFRRPLRLQDLFEHDTIRKMVIHLGSAAMDEADAVAAPTLQARGGRVAVLAPRTLQRIFANEQLHQDRALYNVPLLFKLHGTVDATALQHALRLIVDRHESLRLRIDGGEPGAFNIRFEAGTNWTLDRISLHRDTRDEFLDDDRTGSPLNALLLHLFDLSRDSPLKGTLVSFGDTEHLLVLVFHHASVDGQSLAAIKDELGTAYRALAQGGSPSLPSQDIDFGDYAHSEQVAGAGINGASDIAFFAEFLSGAPPQHSLVLDRPRRPSPSFDGDSFTVHASREQVQSWKKFAQVSEASLFSVLLAPLHVLIARLGGVPDTVIGTIAGNRQHPQLSRVVGCFVNLLPIRGVVDESLPAAEFLRRVHRVSLAVLERQATPFDDIARTTALSHAPGLSPVCQIVLVLQNAGDSDALDLGDAEVTEVHPRRVLAKFDLTVDVRETRDGADLMFEFATDVFDVSSVRTLAEQYVHLLEEFVSSPETVLRDLALADASRVAEAYRRLNGPSTRSGPGEASVCMRFAEVCRSHAGQVAVAGPLPLTYRQLDDWSDRVCAILRSTIGDCTAATVGVLYEPSAQFVVAVLAILKAGASYLPLDPDYPQQRILDALKDCGATVVLGRSGASSRRLEDTIVLDVDVEPSSVGSALRTDRSHRSAADCAYVMYTSGTSGSPKGVRISHGSVVSLVCETNYLQVQPFDRVAFCSSPAFDAATFEVWGALLNGATVVPVPRPVLLDLSRFGTLLKRERISVLWLTKTLFDEFVRHDKTMFAGLRCLLTGGEALSVPVVNALLEGGAPPRRLLNGYGPTETTTFACTFEVTAPVRRGSVPIGKPVAGSQVWVVDELMRLLPPGVPGELCISGQGLFEGYHGDPALTSGKRGMAITFDGVERPVYRTGDRARLLPDGLVEFLGRTDSQVKLHGYRFSLREVEDAVGPPLRLAAHANIVEQGGQRELWLVLAGSPEGEADKVEDLARGICKTLLPKYMRPNRIVVVARPPLTTNGKLDWRMLAKAPPSRVTSQAAGQVAPAAAADKEALLSLWRETLGEPDLSAYDDFFDHGGDSILAMRLVHRARQRGIHLLLADLFESSSVEGYLSLLASRRAEPERHAPQPVAQQREAGEEDIEELPVDDEEPQDPRDPVQALVRLWRRTLGNPRIKEADNFFEMGGNSMMAMRLVQDARRTGIGFGIADIFEAPSPRELASRLEASFGNIWSSAASAEAADSGAVPADHVLFKDPPPGASRGQITSSQRGIWYAYKLHPDSAVYNVPLVFAIDGHLNVPAFAAALKALAAKHPILRTTFAGQDDGSPYCWIHEDVVVPVDEIHADGNEGEAVPEALMAYVRDPFDLESAPLFKTAYAKRGGQVAWLAISFHHILLDAWSISDVLKDLSAFYAEALRSENVHPDVQRVDNRSRVQA
jgi:amino acid adenylation domain-containing protein